MLQRLDAIIIHVNNAAVFRAIQSAVQLLSVSSQLPQLRIARARARAADKRDVIGNSRNARNC